MKPTRFTGCAVLLVLSTWTGGAWAQGDKEKERVFMPELVARTLFRGLLEGTPAVVMPLCADKVSLDGEWVSDKQELQQRFTAMGRRAREQGLRLRQITVLSYTEAVRRFGPPPARLKDVARPGTQIALARLSALGAVVILRRVGPFWKVAGLTD
jgi:hypothetical protein